MKEKMFFILIAIICFYGCDDNYDYSYYDSGEIKEKYRVVNGLKNGVYIEYYSNGVLKTEGEFKNGSANGVFKTYYESGKLQSESNYINNQYTRMHVFYENGNSCIIGDFKNEQNEKTLIFFKENGDSLSFQIYVNNKKVYHRYYGEKGEIVDEHWEIAELYPPQLKAHVKKGEKPIFYFKLYGPKPDSIWISKYTYTKSEILDSKSFFMLKDTIILNEYALFEKGEYSSVFEAKIFLGKKVSYLYLGNMSIVVE